MSKKDSGGFRLHALAAAIAFSAVALPASAGGPDLSGLQSDTSFDQFIVKFRVGSKERASAAGMSSSLDRVAKALPAGKSIRLQHKRQMALGMDVIRADRRLDRVEAEALMRQLAADPDVEHVEVDVLMRALVTPNDSRYNEQWHYYQPTGGFNLPAAWDRSTGSGVVVAVVDTGYISHADLNANILPGYDFVSSTTGGNGGSGDGNGRDSDPTAASGEEHGTHVAGTIAAVTNNGSGVAGVAYNAKVFHARVLGNGGYGSSSDIADAIVWASGGTVSGVPANANPAEVINLSLGGASTCTSSSAYQTAINSAVGRGSTVVVAAGNSNNDVAGYTPAGCANVVAVAAGDINGNRAWYSNYGAKIDVTAPGGETFTCSAMNGEFWPLGFELTTLAQCGTQINTTTQGVLSTVGGGGYDFYQGTSMAAPHVAGVVALMQARAATPLTPAQVETTLKNTVRTIPAANCPGGCGAGFVNADAAVAAVGGGTPTNNPPTANFTSAPNGLAVQFTDTSTDSDGSITSRSWNFGDGTTSTATNPSKTYSAAGTYTVKLTVTDDDGASNTRTASVTVTGGGGGGSVLTKGVPVTGLSAAAGASLNYTMVVPAGATNLKFTTSGGTGDADLYVKFGSAPTDSSYDCRPYQGGNAESCTFAAPQAGTYYVRVKGYSAFSGLSLVGDYTAGGGGGSQTYSNGTDVNIPDNNATGASSNIAVSGRTGNGGASTPVTIAIVHPYIGDLIVDLVAPDGSVYNIHNRSGGSADNINRTVNINLSGEALNGTWRLRAADRASSDVGRIDSWSITF